MAVIRNPVAKTIDVILAKTYFKDPCREDKEPKFLAYIGSFTSATHLSALTERILADRLRNYMLDSDKSVNLRYDFSEQIASEMIPSPKKLTKKEYEKITRAYSASGL